MGQMGPILGDGAVVTSEYGGRIHPITGNWKFHKGVDVSDGIDGSPVYAACDGVISFADYCDPNGYGSWIEIKTQDDTFGEIVVGYGHTIPIVVVGQGVTKGMQIGYQVKIGSSTGAHVHLEVMNGAGENLDPGLFFPQYAGASGGAGMGAGAKFVWDAMYKFAEPLQDIAEKISDACIKGLEKLKDAMVYIFFLIIVIDLVYGVSMLIIDSENGNNFFKWLLSKTMMYLILLYIISHWAAVVANFMRDFYVGAAANAMSTDITTAQNAVANPFDLLQKGANIVSPVLTNLMHTDYGFTTIVAWIFGILSVLAIFVIFILIMLICFQILMAYIEFYMVMLFSFVMFVTSGSKHVRRFAARAFNAVFMVCAKLMFMIFFSLLIQNVMADLKTDNLIEQKQIAISSGGEKIVFDTLKGLGASNGQIAGIMGNIQQEDGPFDPTIQNSAGYTGLFQWDPVDRWPRFVRWCNSQSPALDPYNSAVQVRYAVVEEYGNLLGNISHDPEQAAADWLRIFERSGEGPGDIGYENRIRNARQYAGRINNEILDGATNGAVSTVTIAYLNFVLLIKIIVILMAFMFIADRISTSLIKAFANGGFKFAND